MMNAETWLADWFSRHAPHITIKAEDNFFDAGAIDSFGVIELIEDMEQEFSVRFSQDDFQDKRFSSITGLVEILKEKSAL